MINIYEKENIDYLSNIITNAQERLRINDDLMSILHGNMSGPLIRKLKKDMPQSYKDAIDRLTPINFLKRINDKITHIYQTGVMRTVIDGTENDQKALDQYVLETNLNEEFNYNNELLNVFGYSLQSLAIDENGKNYSVAVDNNKFIPVNLSKNRKNKLDLLILIMDKVENIQTYWVWTDDQFLIMDADKKVRWDLMDRAFGDSLERSEFGVENPYQKIPYQYITTSRTSIMPEIAYDVLQIALVIPLLMTDMNYISKFTAFSILWTLDIDNDALPQTPNATWNLKSDGGTDLSTDKKPQIGTIKPDGDTDKMIALTMFVLSSWLESLGVPTGAIGKVDGANFQNGISKILDELDVSDLRVKQTKIYSNFEKQYFDRYFHYLNPVFITAPNYNDVRHVYSNSAYVLTEFPIQRPIINRMEILNEVEKELSLKLITKERALKRIHPEKSQNEIDEMLSELESEYGGEKLVEDVNDEEESNEENEEIES